MNKGVVISRPRVPRYTTSLSDNEVFLFGPLGRATLCVAVLTYITRAAFGKSDKNVEVNSGHGPTEAERRQGRRSN